MCQFRLLTAYFEIACGERRFRACKIAGLDAVPVDVVELTDEAMRAIQLVENDERADLLVSERVTAYGQYAADGKTAEDIRALTGRPVAEVRAILLLRRLPAGVLEAIDAGRLGRVTAELIARVPGDESRALVAACVLAGKDYIDRGRKAPKPSPDAEVLTVRETKELIRRDFQVELKSAPFSRIALDLIEGATSCDACPNMAGNAAKEDPTYKEVRADTCLDPECFRRKVEAHNSRKIDALKKHGRKFLAPKEAVKAFSAYDGASVGYGAPYVDLDGECHDDPKGRTYRTLLNGCLPADEIVVGIDRNGDPHELLDKSAAKLLLKETGKVPAPRQKSASEKRSKEDERIRFAVVKGAMEAAAAAGERLLDPVKPDAPHLGRALAAMCNPLAQEFWTETVSRVLRRRKWSAIAPADGREALGVIAELLAAKLLSADKGKEPFFAALGIDLEKIEADAKKSPEVQALAPPTLLDKTPPTLGGGEKQSEPTPAKKQKVGASARTSGGGGSGSKPSTSAGCCPPVEKVVACARRSIVERISACLRCKESDLGSVSKENAPMEARLMTKLVMVKGFPTTVAGMLSRAGMSTVRELFEQADEDDLIAGTAKTLLSNGCSEPQTETCIQALETLFRIPSQRRPA